MSNPVCIVLIDLFQEHQHERFHFLLEQARKYRPVRSVDQRGDWFASVTNNTQADPADYDFLILGAPNDSKGIWFAFG